MSLRISDTGIRNGETVMGTTTSKQCRGTVFVVRGFYPPSRSWINNLKLEQIRDEFNNYRFFGSMSAEERMEWLQQHGTSHPDLYMEDVPDLAIKFLNIGGDFMLSTLRPDQVNQLLTGNPLDPDGYWPIQTVYMMFPRKPNSRANKHTLIFRPNNWTLCQDKVSLDSNYTGLTLHLESGTVWEGQINQDDFTHMFVLHSEPKLALYAPTMAIVTSTPSLKTLKAEDILELGASIGLDLGRMQEIASLINWFPPSLHKSLIQKILRVRCTSVIHAGHTYHAKEVLVASMALLMSHPGAFVPNIQRFVSGLESALKRLAVAIFEDAWLENGVILTSLLAGAWIAQNHREWIPSDIQIKIWLGYGCLALDSPAMYEYDWHSIDDPMPIPEWTPWYLSYFLLATIRSFDSDIKMVGSIAQNQGEPSKQIDMRTDRSMPLIHCIDQHAITEIVHYLPYAMVAEIGSYPAVFKQIWHEVTGLNSRKGDYDFIQNPNPFFNAVRQAQDLVWASRTVDPQTLPCGPDLRFEYRLNPCWLAALVGSIEINLGNVTAIVMINPDDLSHYTAIKRPSRDKKGIPELTEAEKAAATRLFRQRLTQGIPLSNVPPTLPMFHNTIVQLDDDDSYLLHGPGGIIPWDDCLNLGTFVPSHPPFTGDYLRGAIEFRGVGIRVGADQQLDQFLRECPRPVLERAAIYMNYNTEIELYHVGRDGTGTDYTVTVEDTGVNLLLSMIATLYPGALLKSRSKYVVQNGPLMWSLVARIGAHCQERFESDDTSVKLWPTTRPEHRLLWAHQTEAIQNLIETRGLKRARLIWIDAGLGKTAIIANYMSALITAGHISPYCLYTLPPSAMATVGQEFELLGIPWAHIDFRASSKGPKDVVPGRVNVVYHDHLRMMNLNQIKEIAPQMLFIVDEFHKTLNPTRRTSTALEISYLARDTIAMTGTLIKDTNIDPIIVWLSMAVNFEVTSRNYWVALSSIISRKVQTRVGVERIVEEAPLIGPLHDEYYNLVPPKLGGTAAQIQFGRAVEISYQVITHLMIETILSYHREGRGVFVVARNRAHQHQLEAVLGAHPSVRIFLIGHDQAIDLTPTHPPPSEPAPNIVITTPTHAEGYNMTRFSVMVSGVYMINTSTQIQLEARINRLSQTAPQIQIVLIHAGIISYIHRRHESARYLNETLRGFAKEVGLTRQDLAHL